MKEISRLLLTIAAILCLSVSAKAIGWPSNYQGVMLQGFYWDSYSETSWANLEANADELSKYFSLIWIPNSAKAEGSPSMGYHPIYWFTNYNSSFGTEAELRSMINTYKEKGVGIIADVVINHRSGVSNWTNFPSEIWNGVTYKIDVDGICCDDEVKDQSDQATPTGAADTGEGWSGSRDLDHTNANVQANCKAYINCLLTDFGYAGVRYDFVKGYAPAYTKIYNEANNVEFSVGEYYDSSYDSVAAWIDGTGGEGEKSAAFDFPFKFAVNSAFSDGDMTKLVWKANGTTDQPAGMIHYGYCDRAVTFIDNHDTYIDSSKFTGNVVAANAFMLLSPGTPCVFYVHYKLYKTEIQNLINIRNACGIHSQSAVTVLQSSTDCYMAEITGTNGKAVVKIGSALVSPSGYTDNDIVVSGTDYCVWTKVEGIDIEDPEPIEAPDQLYIMGDLKEGSWQTNVGIEMTKSDNTFTATDVELVAVTGETKAYFSFVTALGTTGDSSEWDSVINAGDRFGATSEDASLTSSATMQQFYANVDASSAYAWGVTPGTYTITADFDKMLVTISGDGDTTTDVVNIYFDNSNSNWTTPYIHYWGGTAESTYPGVAMNLVRDNIWKYECPAGTSGCLFNAGDGDNTKTSDFEAINNHVYTTSGDQGSYFPSTMYIIGNINGTTWSTSDATAPQSAADGVYKWSNLVIDAGEGYGYFSFITTTGSSWDVVNGSDRYGAATEDEVISVGTPATVVLYAVNVSASSAKAWKVVSGTYDVTLDLDAMTVSVAAVTSVIDDLEADNAQPPVYFNLQGVRVDNPKSGLFIEECGGKVRKVAL